jgi:hypothetical protein
MKRQQTIDPAVMAALTDAERKREARGGEVQRQKVNVNLPLILVTAIKQEATSLTGHRRRGFSDLVTVLLQYGWKAYQAGELKLGVQAVRVEMRIVVDGGGD